MEGGMKNWRFSTYISLFFVSDVSNSIIFNDLEWSSTRISRSRHFWRWLSQKRYEIHSHNGIL